MGDSGPCHPRDGIAMSWLSEKLKLSSNLFDKLMEAREHQTEWLAHMFKVVGTGMKKIILGKAYKAESEITTGSAAILLANILKEWDVDFDHYDPYVDGADKFVDTSEPKAYLIATKHECFQKYLFAEGSVVVDPFRYIPDQKEVKLIQVGVGK
jgi:UDPglucose 6-dehydrogenase